jgi:hypothetical protein
MLQSAAEHISTFWSYENNVTYLNDSKFIRSELSYTLFEWITVPDFETEKTQEALLQKKIRYTYYKTDASNTSQYLLTIRRYRMLTQLNILAWI